MEPRKPASEGYLPSWAVITFVVLIAIAAFLFIFRAPEAPQVVVSEHELSDRPTLGRDDAPIHIVVFSDFACPHCRDFDHKVLPRLEQAFVETAQAKLTFLHYPFISEASVQAALAAECVYQQDRTAFWNYKSALFDMPKRSWMTEELVALAENVAQFDVIALTACIREDLAREAVLADKTLAESLHLPGIPTVLVDGQMIVPPSFEAVRRVVEGRIASDQ